MGLAIKIPDANYSASNLGKISIAVSYYTVSAISNNTSYGTVSGGGSYQSGQTVTLIANANNGCEFVSWNDGNTSSIRTITVTSSVTYTATFKVSSSSQPTDQCVAPTCSPASGTYTSGQSVTLSSATSGATIHYTTDGSTPTSSSPVYSSAIYVSGTQVIRAIAVKSGMASSSVSVFAFIINSSGGGTSESRTMSINNPASTDGTAQLSVSVSSGSTPTNLTWSITSGSEYATIDPSTGLLTMKWSDTAHAVTVHVVDNFGGLTADKTLSVTKVWHPTQLTSDSGFETFSSAYILSSLHDGPVVAPYGSNADYHWRERRAIWVLPKNKAPDDTLSSSTGAMYGSYTTDVSEFRNEVDENVAANYSRILIPKGCKTITFAHSNSVVDLGFFIADDYYENSGANLLDRGWVGGGSSINLDVSNYNGGINGSKKYYVTPNARLANNGSGTIPTGQPVISESNIKITFNY